MKNQLFKITLLVMSLIAGGAEAKLKEVPKKIGHHRVNVRQDNQDQRIQNGLENGRLTKEEYDRLMKAQERIAATEKKMMADGKLSKKDAEKLELMQAKASKRIYKQKHDKQRNRMKRMADRIEKGVKRGMLTEAELKQLEASRQAIIDFRKQAMADGKLSAFERKTLRSMKDNASQEIHKLKHNDREPAADSAAETQVATTTVQTSPTITGVQ